MSVRLPIDWDGIIPDPGVDFEDWLAVGTSKNATHIYFDASLGTNFDLVWEVCKDSETGVNLDTSEAQLISLGNGVFSLVNNVRALGAYFRVHPSTDIYQVVNGSIKALGVMADVSDEIAELNAKIGTPEFGTVVADIAAYGTSTVGDILFTWYEYAAGHEGDPAHAISDVEVVVYNNSSATPPAIASGFTDELGKVAFYLDAGTYYLYRRKGGRNFTNPATVEVSE